MGGSQAKTIEVFEMWMKDGFTVEDLERLNACGAVILRLHTDGKTITYHYPDSPQKLQTKEEER